MTAGESMNGGQNRPGPAGLALTLLLAGVLAGMASLSASPQYLWSSGAGVAGFNALSLALAPLLLLSCHSLGQLLCRFEDPGRHDAFLASTVAGMAAFMALGYAVGLAGLLTPLPCGALLCAPLLFLRTQALLRGLRDHKASLVFFALLFVYLFAAGAVLTNYLTNDFGHYLPMYEAALLRGDLSPSVFFNSYFAAKGNGLGMLVMAATSRHAIAVVGFLALAMLLLLGHRFLLLLTPSRLLAALFVVALLATRVVRFELYKAHVLSSMFVLSVPYLLSLWFLAARRRRPAVLRAVLCTLAGMLVITPLDGVFISLPMLVAAGLAWSLGRRRQFAQAAALVPYSLAVFLGMLALNFALTGLPEIKPYTFFLPFMDLPRVDLWGSSNALVSLGSINHSTGFVFTGGKLALLGLKAVLACAALWAAHRLLRRLYPVRVRHYVAALGPAVSLFVLTIFLKDITRHFSFKDHTAFESVLNRLFVAGAILLALALAQRLPRLGAWLRDNRRRSAAVLFALMALHGAAFNWLPPLREQTRYAKAFVGALPPAETFGTWRDTAAEKALGMVPGGERIFPLYFTPYAYVIPGLRFERPENSLTMRSLATIMDADAGAAARSFESYGLRRFLVFLPTELGEGRFCTFNVYQYYAPLFDAENVAARFRVRRVEGNVWLMTLDGADADGQIPDREFLERYRMVRKRDIAIPDNYSLSALRKMTERLPDLARARNPYLNAKPADAARDAHE